MRLTATIIVNEQKRIKGVLKKIVFCNEKFVKNSHFEKRKKKNLQIPKALEWPVIHQEWRYSNQMSKYNLHTLKVTHKSSGK